MEHRAFYKDIGNIGYNTTVLYFKVDGEMFSISFGCYFKPERKRKIMGNKLLKRMVQASKYISICDHLSNYVFDSGYGKVVDISGNKRLVEVVLNMRRELHRERYKKMNGKDPIEMKPKLLTELYTNVWKK